MDNQYYNLQCHIKKQFWLFNNEINPFRKVHRLIDLFETIIKTHTAVIISDYFRHKDISDKVKGLLAEGLRVPSLGTWQYFSREILSEMKKQNLPPFIDGFYEYFEQWDKKYFGGGKIDVISFRNGYAHGATPDDEECLKDIAAYEPIIKEMLKAEWLNKTTIACFEKENDKLIPVEIDSYTDEFLIDEILKKLTGKNIKTNLVYLINGEGDTLDLFPIIQQKRIKKKTEEKNSILFFNDLKKKDAISLLSYPYALHIRDKEIFSEFMEIIKVEEWKQKTTEEFKERIEELTEVFKGRVEERESIKKWINRNEKGFLFIYGNPGVGKSALIAQTFKELQKESKEKIELIEYFIRRGTDHSKPGRLLTYLSKRLEAKHKTGVDTGITNDEMKEKLDERLRILSEIENRKKIVIFIDGLDEGDENRILDYIINDTYKNIVVIYGSRWTDEVESFYNRQSIEYKKKEEIKGLKKEDIRGILYEVTDKYAITKEQIEEVAEKSQGNPLYIKMLTLAIEEGEIKLEDGIKLPKKIDEFYKLFIERYSKQKDGDEILKSLYLFAAAKDYLTQKHLEKILNFGPATSERVITTLQEVLYDNPNTEEKDYQLFHESMREYLEKKKKRDLYEAEIRILDYCRKWKEYETKEEQIYPIKHFAEHLYNQNKKDELFELIINREYPKKQIELTEQYEAGFKAVELGLRAWEEDSYKLIEIGIEAARLHLNAKNSLEQIKRWIEEGGKENYEKALKRILNYKERERVILYFMLLNKAADKEDKDVVELVVYELDDNLIKDTSTLNINTILTLPYIFNVTAKIDEQNWKNIVERVEIIKQEEIQKLNGFEFTNSSLYLLALFIKQIKDGIDKAVTLAYISSELIKQGEKAEASNILDEALKVVEKIVDNSDKTAALIYISSELEMQGKKVEASNILEEAVKIAEMIVDKRNKSATLLSISSEFVKQSKTLEAKKVAEKIEVSIDKVVALISISSKLANQGKKAEAYNILAKAIKVVEKIVHDWDKIAVLLPISSELVKQEKAEEAKELAEKIVDKRVKAKVLLSISSELAKLENETAASNIIAEAVKVAEKVEVSLYKAVTLLSISSEFEKQGKKAEASKILVEVIKIVEKLEYESDKTGYLLLISSELANQGKSEEAMKLVEKIENSKIKAEEFVSISSVLVKQGKEAEASNIIAKAIKVVEKINDFWVLDTTCISISSELAKQGRTEEAIIVAEKINDFWDKIESLASISEELAKQGKTEEAIIVAEKITDFWDIDYILILIISEFAKHGKFEEAMKVVEKIKKNWINAKSLASISTELAKQGKKAEASNLLTEAAKVAKKIDYDIDKAAAFLSLSSEFGKQGKETEASNILAEALKVVEKVEGDWDKNIVIETILLELVKQGREAEASNIFVKAIKKAKKIESDLNKSEVLVTITSELVKQGKTEKAIKIAEKINGDCNLDEIYLSISSKFAKQGKTEEAIKMAEKIEFSGYKAESLISISSELAKQGKEAEAFILLIDAAKEAEMIVENNYKAETLISISSELVKQGKVELAIKMAEKMNFYYYEFKTLLTISSVLTEQGKLEEALKVVELLEADLYKAEALVSISSELIKQGEEVKASNILEFVSNIITEELKVADKDNCYVTERLISISSKFVEQGNEVEASNILAKALKVSEMIEDDLDKAEALISISSELVKQGKEVDASNMLAKAIKVTENIASNMDKSSTFVTISSELAKQGNIEDAIKLVEKIENVEDKTKSLLSISSELVKQGKLHKVIKLLEISPNGKSEKEILENFILNIDYDLIKTAENQIVNSLYKGNYKMFCFYLIVSRIISSSSKELFDILPKYSVKLFENLDYFIQVLFGAAVYLRFIKESLEPKDKKLLKKLNEVIEISDWLDWEEPAYGYSNLSDWINSIEDEDDKEQIELWIKKVEKGKMSEEEFDNEINSIINKKV